MNSCMRRLSGLDRAAITKVEPTTASWGSLCWPVSVWKRAWVAVYASEVHQRKHQCERTVDEGAVDEEVYVVEAVPRMAIPVATGMVLTAEKKSTGQIKVTPGEEGAETKETVQ